MIESTIQISGYSISKTIDMLQDAGKMEHLIAKEYEFYNKLMLLEKAVQYAGNDHKFNICLRLFIRVKEILEEE